MNEQAMEFGFTAELPQRKTKEGLISQVKRFWKETDGGAIPVALAAKILKCSPQGIYKYIKNGKIRGTDLTIQFWYQFRMWNVFSTNLVTLVDVLRKPFKNLNSFFLLWADAPSRVFRNGGAIR